METNPKIRKTIRIPRKWLIIGMIALVIIIVAILVSSLNNRRGGVIMGMSGGGYGMMEDSATTANSVPEISFGDDYGARYPSPYPNPSPDITDTREFLKVSYSAQIQTRDVADKVKDIKNAVRDAEGRVDNFSSSEKYGYVSFVVSKDKFDQLKDEIESLTKKKLYTENISSQNLLGQKQGIEQQGESIAARLVQLEKQKKNADAAHAARVVALQNDADGLVQENKTYTANNNSLVAQIAQQKKNLEGNVKQDIDFGNNIETVTGSVNVNWVSCWEIIKIYSPIHPTIIIIVLVLGLLYFLNRKSYLPKIEIM